MIASERFGFGLALLDPNIYSLAWPNRITFLELTLFMMLLDEEGEREQKSQEMLAEDVSIRCSPLLYHVPQADLGPG